MNREPNLSSRYTVELLEYGEYYGVRTEYLRENTGKKKEDLLRTVLTKS